jgi:hypothetical protein
MKRLALLTRRVTLQLGAVIVVAMMGLVLSSTSAHRAGVVALAATVIGMMSTPVAAAAGRDTALRPFTVKVPETDLAGLRRRIAATKWPEREPVPDASQGCAARDDAEAREVLGDRVRLAPA